MEYSEKVRLSVSEKCGDQKSNSVLQHLKAICQKRAKTLLGLQLEGPLKTRYETQDSVNYFEAEEDFEIEVQLPKYINWDKKVDLFTKSLS